MKTLKDVLQKAEHERFAAGHFNFSELVAFNAIGAAARQLHLPVMVGVSEGEREFVGVRQAAALVRSVREEYGQPIFLNADHTHSIAKAEEAAKAGFDEIIFDGSGLPFEENIADQKGRRGYQVDQPGHSRRRGNRVDRRLLGDSGESS
jgi:fructose-bisphosphate aldolase, class II